ncbi:choice-of-anchor I family protein [[Limnothrix rosea] IAM M-220]|uniref:choice-of-anchor I family protein n=1 Tax=[Limnothrix rosea] IAM M-220 TaxID=454133 RepID=UPI000963ED32|nr:choice-of-anchor I family protein [[Limnothrix rosea] IAM M-220]OKH17904.1 alkaline phosphatase [[Limnothrix rosea] IAM M-220]
MNIKTLLGLCLTPATIFFGEVATAEIRLTAIGRYSTGVFDDSAAEIATFDPGSNRLFVTNAAENQVDVLDLADPTNPTLAFSIDVDYNINSVSFYNGVLAAAVEGESAQDPGTVRFFDGAGNLLNTVMVGALPDMVTFTPDGMKVLTANEGEPSEDYTIDPEGSVSIIDISAGVENATVTTAMFTAFNDMAMEKGIRVFGLGATLAEDVEPEYIAVSADSTMAWVTLQEANALGVVDLTAGEIVDVVNLGVKDYSQPSNRLDASNKDDAINITNYDNLFGLYQPDAIAAYEVNGETYLVTANEGDSRLRPTGDDEVEGFEEGDIFNEESRIGRLDLDPTAFPNAEKLQDDAVLGRLKVTNTMGDTDGDGDFDELYAYGGRSFSIWRSSGDLVFDSGSQFADITVALFPEHFNSTNDENGSFDDRSDDKGAEPEGVTVGMIGDRHYAFIGLERMGGIMVYDVSDPMAPFFVTYANDRDFKGDAEAGTAGDLGPEGLLFIPANDSPNGENLLVVTSEVSGTVTVYSVTE